MVNLHMHQSKVRTCKNIKISNNMHCRNQEDLSGKNKSEMLEGAGVPEPGLRGGVQVPVA